MKASTTRTWLLSAALATAWLCCNAALDGQPSDTDAERATAAAARDVERAALFLNPESQP